MRQSGATYSCALGEILTGAEYGISARNAVDGDLPIAGMANIVDGQVDLSQVSRVGRSGVDVDRYRLREGDVLFNRTNSPRRVGKTGIGARSPSEDVVFASYLVRLSPDRTRVLPHFLNLLLNTPSIQRQIRKLATPGVSQVNVNPSVLSRAVTVPVPPLRDQEVIVGAVASWTAALELVAKLIAAKELFVGALTQRAVTGQLSINGSRAWRKRHFSDFFQHFVEENGTTLRTILSCSKIDGIVPQATKFERRLAPAYLGRYKVVRDGDLVVDRMLLWDGSLAFVECGEGVVSPDYATFHFNEREGDRDYFKALIRSSALRHDYRSLARGSNTRRRRVLPKDFLRIAVLLPDLNSQVSLGVVFRNLREEIELLKRLRMTLQSQRRSVTEALVTGKKQPT